MRMNEAFVIVLVLATLSLISAISAQGDCIEGETKSYTCPNGTEVSWCVCEDEQWACIISPENQCVGYCREGETKEYTCPDGTNVPWCVCENNQFACIISPENQCPSVTTTTIVTPITYEGDGTYVLNVGDFIEASNGYLIKLTLAFGEHGTRSDWRTDIDIYDPNGELIKNHISWGNGTIDIDYITIKYERFEEGKATVTVNSYDITTSTIPSEPSLKLEPLTLIGIFVIVVILIVILFKMKK